MQMPQRNVSMDEIMALCKRRGFIYQASEIYGGINGFWDYGPLGAMLKNNLRQAWWNDVVMTGCNGAIGPDGRAVSIVPIDSCIIQNPKVWEASGHVAGFNDPMVDDKETKQRFRADHLRGLYYHNLKTNEDFLSRFAAEYRGELYSATLPIATFVASSDAETAALAETSRNKLLSSYERTGPFELDEAGVLGAACKNPDGVSGWLVICEIPIDTQNRLHDKIVSPFTGKAGSLTEPRMFNLMFETHTGAIHDDDSKAYLRPETAQGIFINFKNVVDTMRVRVPFGIAQIGKAFRNEVTPRNFTFRSREFEQMEVEFFCHPDQKSGWYEFWRDWRMTWWESIGLAGENLQLREHEQDELSHYSAATSDIEYRFPFTAPGFGELEGVADRGNFDLTQHAQASRAKLEYFDHERDERYLPHVIEPSAGLDRGVLAVLCEAFTPTPDRKGSKFVMSFHPRLAPIKAAVYPLVKKDGMPEIGQHLHAELMGRFASRGMIVFDAKQSIGKRYARMDEAGCPFCFTIDSQTLEDQTVTVRERDTAAQERIGLDRVGDYLGDRLGAGVDAGPGVGPGGA